MGVLTDMFAARDDELTPELLECGPLERVPTVEGKGCDEQWMLCILRDGFGIAAASAQAYIDACAPRAVSSDGHRIIVPVPIQLTTAIAACDTDQLMRVRVVMEGRDEETIRSDILFGRVPDWLDEIAELCRDALGDGRNVYIWMCA
jgi:hypothetical protein